MQSPVPRPCAEHSRPHDAAMPESRNSASPSPPPLASGSGRARDHTPIIPSQLRASQFPPSSPEDIRNSPLVSPGEHDPREAQGSDSSARAYVETSADVSPRSSFAQVYRPNDERNGVPLENSERQWILDRQYDRTPCCDSEHCDHGTFSPRPSTWRSYGSIRSPPPHEPTYTNSAGQDASGGTRHRPQASYDVFLARDANGKRMSKTAFLAQEQGIRNRTLMYLPYYIPFLNWIKQYKWSYLQGDLISALTMASFYIPMSLSYASNLGHIPPINGLYSFVFNPLVYAFLGTSPQMVVGPEAAGSLLTGNVVRESIERGKHGDQNAIANAMVAGTVTAMAGVIILVAGIARLGFLDSVLSRPFLRGFISAIGIVILVDQLIPETGLSKRASHVGGAAHGSSLDKFLFICGNIEHAHRLTCAVSLGCFAIIMVCRYVDLTPLAQTLLASLQTESPIHHWDPSACHNIHVIPSNLSQSTQCPCLRRSTIECATNPGATLHRKSSCSTS